MDIPLSMVSFLGFIALIGILVNDALVFITTFNDKIKAGESFKDALYNTGLSRFRPIVLTSVTTIVGLGPIILEKSLGAQLLIPMAVSLAFGLLVITVIILALIPALLQILHGVEVGAVSFWEGASQPELASQPEVEANDVEANVVFVVGVVLALILFFGLGWVAWWAVGSVL